jgi:hypothetical protein
LAPETAWVRVQAMEPDLRAMARETGPRPVTERAQGTALAKELVLAPVSARVSVQPRGLARGSGTAEASRSVEASVWEMDWAGASGWAPAARRSA